MFFQKRISPPLFFSILAFYLPALPLILLDYNVGRAYIDQHFGHLPAIHFFAQHPTFSDYPSATSPGYHVLMAMFSRILPDSVILLKLISSLITAALIGLSAWFMEPRSGRFTPLLLLPMILSLYILPNGVWLVPDNLAWLTVALLYLLALRPEKGGGFLVLSAILLCVAVFVRQSNLWLASIPWAVGLGYLLFDNKPTLKRYAFPALCILATVPAFLLLAWFVLLWKGLVPPSVQGRHERAFSFSAPAFFLSVFFVYGAFYLPLAWTAIKARLQGRYSYLLFGAVIGLLAAVLPVTDYNYEAGRFSGFWNFVRIAPVLGHRSLLMLVTSTLGGGLLAAFLLLLERRLQLLFVCTIPAFVLAMIPNTLVLERYFAGFVFLLLLFFLHEAENIDWNNLPAGVYAAPLLFALINLFFLCRGLIS